MPSAAGSDHLGFSNIVMFFMNTVTVDWIPVPIKDLIFAGQFCLCSVGIYRDVNASMYLLYFSISLCTGIDQDISRSPEPVPQISDGDASFLRVGATH